jgi:hypothetical protein
MSLSSARNSIAVKHMEGTDLIDSTPRKPRVFLLILLPILFFGGLGAILAMISLFARLRGITLKDVPDFNGMMIALPVFLLWAPLGLLLGNLVIYVTPSLHRIAQEYVAAAGRPGYWESQLWLFKAFLVIALICVPLIVLGFTF